MKCMRSSIFWDVPQHRLAITYRRFGQNLSTPSLRVKESKKKIQMKVWPCRPRDRAVAAGRPAVADVFVLQQDERTTWGETLSLQRIHTVTRIFYLVLADGATWQCHESRQNAINVQTVRVIFPSLARNSTFVSWSDHLWSWQTLSSEFLIT